MSHFLHLHIRCSTAPIDAPFPVPPATDIVAVFLVAAASVGHVGAAFVVVADDDVAAVAFSLVKHPDGEVAVAVFCLHLTKFCHSVRSLPYCFFGCCWLWHRILAGACF